MRFKAGTTEHEELTLNVTALTDVAFLIIIFFMFSTHFHRTQLRPMDLPKEQGAEAAETGIPLVIEIDQQGELSLAGGGPVDLSGIASSIRGGGTAGGSGGNSAKPEVVIRADRRAAAVHLNRLSSELAKLGIRDWKLATSPAG